MCFTAANHICFYICRPLINLRPRDAHILSIQGFRLWSLGNPFCMQTCVHWWMRNLFTFLIGCTGTFNSDVECAVCQPGFQSEVISSTKPCYQIAIVHRPVTGIGFPTTLSPGMEAHPFPTTPKSLNLLPNPIICIERIGNFTSPLKVSTSPT